MDHGPTAPSPAESWSRIPCSSWVSVGDSAELGQSVAMAVRSSTEVDMNDIGMRDYLVIKETATVTEAGAPELLHRLATTVRG
jgi:hypothetical protein